MSRAFLDASNGTRSMLDSHRLVEGIEQVNRSFPNETSATSAISKWQQENPTAIFPEDMKAFYGTSDGLHIKWSVRFKEELVPMGFIQINRLAEITQVYEGYCDISSQNNGNSCCKKMEPQSNEISHFDSVHITAYDLDNSCRCGKVALVFFDSTSTPEIWFQDLRSIWHFLAFNFTNYYRLLSLHMGVPHWQLMFTGDDLDPTTSHWLRLLCPERLALWETHHKIHDSTSSQIKYPNLKKIDIERVSKPLPMRTGRSSMASSCGSSSSSKPTRRSTKRKVQRRATVSSRQKLPNRPPTSNASVVTTNTSNNNPGISSRRKTVGQSFV